MKHLDVWHSLLRDIHTLDDANTGSTAAMLMAKTWHTNCTRNHIQCQKRIGGGFLPTRALYIRSAWTSNRVKLVNDTSLREPYIALSHRWGTEILPTTIRDNLATRLSGFKMADLPPIMRDAIWIARSLQYDYIWVDALCIVQDSEED